MESLDSPGFQIVPLNKNRVGVIAAFPALHDHIADLHLVQGVIFPFPIFDLPHEDVGKPEWLGVGIEVAHFSPAAGPVASITDQWVSVGRATGAARRP